PSTILSDSIHDADDITNEVENSSDKKIDITNSGDIINDTENEQELNREDQIEKLNTRISKVISNPSTLEVIDKVLSNKENPTQCPEFGQYMEGLLGVNLHEARKHKKNK
ncbi:unnamed protein product, partial [Brachionus calyciflorus]